MSGWINLYDRFGKQEDRLHSKEPVPPPEYSKAVLFDVKPVVVCDEKFDLVSEKKATWTLVDSWTLSGGEWAADYERAE